MVSFGESPFLTRIQDPTLPYTKAGHAAIYFEVVEWSEQLRSVTFVWLGAARRSVSSPTLHQRVYELEDVW